MAEVMIQPAELAKMSPCTPSPTTSGTTSSGSRRPTRKSTLTQQQKNHKRQRATQDQLATLEVEFNNNPTPTAMVRDRIAQDINMTERSVQIWFQNRRAKIKTLAKKSIETGEDCDAIPASMRKYLALQAFESGRQIPPDMFGNGSMTGFHGGLFMNTESNASKVAIQHFNCRSLSIGSWRRVGQAALDLVVFYAPEKSWVTYYINADAHGFRIEYPFSYIKNITLDAGDTATEGASDRTGGLIVELHRAPHFSMDPGSGGFFQCRDFTEDHQASHVLTHHLGGHPKVLSGQLAKLVSLDSFRNRHRPLEPAMQMPNHPPQPPPPPPPPPPAPMSAPISPIGPNRPSSQPNHMVHPHHLNVHPDNRFGMALQPGPRGHKRQRSRSVPAAIDFTQFRQEFRPEFRPAYPSYFPQHVQTPAPAEMPSPQIFAPIPQHVPMMQHQMMPHVPPTLSIDSPPPDYGLDYQPGPMSATTANSPSEYEPTFYSAGPPQDNFIATNFNTPYSVPFLSPMVDPSHNLQPSISPLSAVSHGGPMIANQSPPLTSLDRSASAEIYPLTQDSAGFADDAFNFDDMYGKQQFTLPFRSPLEEATDEYDFHNQFVSYGTIDPAALTPNPDRNTSTPFASH